MKIFDVFQFTEITDAQIVLSLNTGSHFKLFPDTYRPNLEVNRFPNFYYDKVFQVQSLHLPIYIKTSFSYLNGKYIYVFS